MESELRIYDCAWPNCTCDPSGMDGPPCAAEHAADQAYRDGSYMRHKPNESCECHDCHVARTRGVRANSETSFTAQPKE